MNTKQEAIPSVPPEGCDAWIDAMNLEGTAGAMVPCRANSQSVCHLLYFKKNAGMAARVISGHCAVTGNTPEAVSQN